MMFSVPGTVSSGYNNHAPSTNKQGYINPAAAWVEETKTENQPVEIITLNLRGINFEVDNRKLKRYPETRLAQLEKENPQLKDGTKVYSFNRNPFIFQYILDFYESGQLHLPTDACHDFLKEELRFWRISLDFLSPCCYDIFAQEEEVQEQKLDVFKSLTPLTDQFWGTREEWEKKSSWRDKAWLMFEDPYASVASKIWSLVLGFAILSLLVSLALGTLPNARIADAPTLAMYENVTVHRELWWLMHTRPHSFLTATDGLCMIIITADYLIRFSIGRTKKAFLCDFANIVQLLAILPMWIGVCIGLFMQMSQPRDEWLVYASATGLLGITRVFLTYRAAKSDRHLRVLIISVRASWRELLLLLLVTNLVVFTFSVLVFYVELREGTFRTLGDAYWWALITMTTVGYGDFAPRTTLGRATASACAVCGVLVIALPVGIIGGNFVQNAAFSGSYHRNKVREKRLRSEKHLKST